MTYSVSELFFHPIKSLGCIQTQKLDVDTSGPSLDRRIMLIDSDGMFITQRQHPMMSIIQIDLLDNRLRLSLNGDSIELMLPNFSLKTESVTVQIWDDTLTGQLISSKASAWLSAKLNTPVRLVYLHDTEFRQVDLNYSAPGVQTHFSDGFPFLLVSQASIDFLSNKVGYELSVNRFRPNIVVSGCDAFEEDTWKKIRIGDIEFDLVKPCSRCVIPTIDPQTGAKQREVMQAMVKYRKKGKGVFVGQNLIHNQIGSLNVGMPVIILA